jgi:methyl acetate hydrolase
MSLTRIDAVLSETVERGDVPGVAAVVVDRNRILFEGSHGYRYALARAPMQADSLFQIASMTKGLASVAAVQMVERGALRLDEPAAEVLPHLAEVRVLEEGGRLRAPRTPVTLRHLLTHTSGFGYGWSSARLAHYLSGAPDGSDAPLLFDPGTSWQYGRSTDWVGRLIEAAAEVPLDKFLKLNVLAPLGMRDTVFEPSEEQVSRFAAINDRLLDDSLAERPMKLPRLAIRGDHGLFSTAADFAQFLRFMLSDGEFAGTRLLQPDSMQMLCTNQVAGLVVGKIQSANLATSREVDLSGDGTAGWSLGFLVDGRPTATGRHVGTVSWAGINNTYYWIDREAGIAGAIFMHVRPFADPRCLAVRDAFETAVYHLTS